MNIIKAVTENKKDLINATNSTMTMKRNSDTELLLTGIIIYNDGEKDVSVIKTDKGFISSISPSVHDSLINILDIYNDDEIKQGIKIKINKKIARRSEREYLYIEIL